jgi:2,3-bisphosphoglycerate-dependent phosphoglycerate mutase
MADPRTQPRWPGHLWIVRHGQSAGNVARQAAMAAGLVRIDLSIRDVDVPLSALGEEQADALGRWFAEIPPDRQPDVVLVSPYLRARETAARIHAQGGTPVPPGRFHVDERLREKEFGVLDLLTRLGIETHHPEQAEFRRVLGKFYHRPPGGESWCDVILRLRSLLNTAQLNYAGRRVLIIAHQVVVLCLRYLLEGMDEAGILAVDRQGDVANCSITEYVPDPAGEGMALVRYNYTVPLQREGEPVTAAPDSPVATR